MPTAAVLFALLALTPPAEQEPQQEPFLHSALYVEAGLGSPLGGLGIESVTRIGPWFEISGGLGIGVAAGESEAQPSLAHMLQWSIMPRLFLGKTEHGGVTLGVGASGGNYGDASSKIICFDDPCASTYPVSYALWANVELGAEAWYPSGFATRIFAGWAHGWCTSSGCGSALMNFPTSGLASATRSNRQRLPTFQMPPGHALASMTAGPASAEEALS